MGSYVTSHDSPGNSYSRQATVESNMDKMQNAITKDPDMNEQQRMNMREYKDIQNSEHNDDHNAGQNTGAYARGGTVKRAGGGCVTARGAATMAKLRARHGKDV